MKNKLTTNLGLKLISVLFSIVLWLVGTSIGNPTTSKSFYNVPVVLENTDAITESGRVYEVLENSDVISRVTIRGPRSVVSSMSESNIVATADVSNISSLDTVSIKLATNINQDQINSITPSSDTVKLNIENKKTKTMALGTKISGEVSDGYMVGDITTDQNLVRISGPESVVTSVSKAVAEITVTGFTSDISTSAEIRLYDADGNAVDDPNITQNIKSVNVQVSILQTKEVPLVFHTQGEPTYGYGFTGNVECDLQTVTICGKSSVLKKIQSIDIPAELLDMTNKSDTFTEEIDLLQYLPDNVQLVDLADSVVAVTVDIEPEISKKIEMRESRIHVTNLPDGFTASVSGVEETFIIEVIGRAQDLSEVQASSLEGTVDINDLMEKFSLEELQEGFYTMEVSFGLPDDVRLLEPVEVVVHISAKQE